MNALLCTRFETSMRPSSHLQKNKNRHPIGQSPSCQICTDGLPASRWAVSLAGASPYGHGLLAAQEATFIGRGHFNGLACVPKPISKDAPFKKSSSIPDYNSKSSFSKGFLAERRTERITTRF